MNSRTFHAALFAFCLMFLAGQGRAETELFVSSHNTHEVYRYNVTNGTLVGLYVTANSGGLSAPHGLAIGPDRNLYVGSAANDRILRYDGTSGAFIDVFVTNASGGLDYPAGIVFGPDGHLYVASQLSDEVLRFHGLTGAFIDAFVTAGSGGLDGPSTIVFGPDTNLYVTGRFDNRVYRYNGFSGAFMDVFVTNQLAQPFGCDFGPDGNFYVASGNDNVIRRFNGQTGDYIDDFASTGLSLPIQFVFGPDGDIYACSFNNDTVRRYDGNSGAFVSVFVTNGSGGLDGPNFLTFSPTGTGPLDRDGDGMPDAWEIQHSAAGLLAGISNAPNSDFDGDRLFDLGEYIADTDPADSNSFFFIQNITHENPVVLQFHGATGRIYAVDYNDALELYPQGWTEIINNIAGIGSANMIEDPDAASATNRNYRVRVYLP